MKKKLQILSVLSEGFSLGLKNCLSILGAIVLWILTIWVPYINVGTTIAICSIPVALAQGKTVSPLFIFESKYRKMMGEVILLFALELLAIVLLVFCGIIPAIVVSIAWGLGIYLVIDKGMSPTEALTRSNTLTYGNKWRIFAISLILGILPIILSTTQVVYEELHKIDNLAIDYSEPDDQEYQSLLEEYYNLDSLSDEQIAELNELAAAQASETANYVDSIVTNQSASTPWWYILLMLVVEIIIAVWALGCDAVIYRELTAEKESPEIANSPDKITNID